jgi:hypothetical protein
LLGPAVWGCAQGGGFVGLRHLCQPHLLWLSALLVWRSVRAWFFVASSVGGFGLVRPCLAASGFLVLAAFQLAFVLGCWWNPAFWESAFAVHRGKPGAFGSALVWVGLFFSA